jgi:hypothetical protein
MARAMQSLVGRTHLGAYLAGRPDHRDGTLAKMYLDLFAAGWGYRYFISGDVCGNDWRPTRGWAGRAGRRIMRRHERMFHSAFS